MTLSTEEKNVATHTDSLPHGALVFVGTYTDYDVLPHFPALRQEWGKGIYTFRWVDGKMNLLSVTPCLNPAVMKYHPKLNVLYALSECIDKHGYVTAFKVDPASGSLSKLGSVEMTGKSTCYLSFDKEMRHVVICNYWDAVLNVVELAEDGTPLRVVQSHQQQNRPEWRQVVDRPDHWANRQVGPHAHCVVFHPSFRWVFVPDLGDNCIYQYGYKDGQLEEQGYTAMEPGVGPRHFVFHPFLPVAFSGCELGNAVQVFAVDDSEPEKTKLRVTPVQRLTSLPVGWEGQSFISEIKVDKSGQYVYASNRGHNSIAVYKVDVTTGMLSLVDIEPTLGKTPRHFGISPDGHVLVAANQDTDTLKTFTIDPAKGSFVPTGDVLEIPCPNYVLFHSPYLN